jgi:hypothetical protein
MSITAIGVKPPQIQVDIPSGKAFDDEFFPALDNSLDDDIREQYILVEDTTFHRRKHTKSLFQVTT